MEPGGREHPFYIEDKKRFMVYYKILLKQWNRAGGKANTNRHECGLTNLCPKTTDESSRALSLETLRQKPPTRFTRRANARVFGILPLVCYPCFAGADTIAQFSARNNEKQGITKNKE